MPTKISDSLWICHPNSNAHWSRRFINHWMFWSACECCHMYRLLIAGGLTGLSPFIILLVYFGWIWTSSIYFGLLAAFIVAGLYNKSTEVRPELVADKLDSTTGDK